MKEAGRAAPHAVPRILGHDEASGLFAMEYLPPEDYPVWKIGVARRPGGPDHSQRKSDDCSR